VNTYTDDEGKLKSYVQTRRRRKSGLLEVIDRSPAAIEQSPDTVYGVTPRGHVSIDANLPQTVQGGVATLYTRLWMVMSPPSQGDAGWAGVLGEVFGGNWRMQERPLFLLDEVSEVLLPKLFRGAAMLKDIYCTDMLYVDPANEMFARDLTRSRWGLCSYDSDYDDDELVLRHPFFASRDRIAGPVDPPYKPDVAWGKQLISELFETGMLSHHATACPVFETGHQNSPHIALAIGVMAMQAYDWSDRFDGVDMDDGYMEEEPSDAEKAQMQRSIESMTNVLWMTGDAGARTELDRSEHNRFEDMVAVVEKPQGSYAKDLSWLG
jgi:hypothetical protein